MEENRILVCLCIICLDGASVDLLWFIHINYSPTWLALFHLVVLFVLDASGLRAEKFPRSIRHLEFWSECKPAVSISNFARALISDSSFNFVDHWRSSHPLQIQFCVGPYWPFLVVIFALHANLLHLMVWAWKESSESWVFLWHGMSVLTFLNCCSVHLHASGFTSRRSSVQPRSEEIVEVIENWTGEHSLTLSSVH